MTKTLYVECGKKHGFNAETLKAALIALTGVAPETVVKVDVKVHQSFVEVDESVFGHFLAKNGGKIGDKSVKIAAKSEKPAKVGKTGAEPNEIREQMDKQEHQPTVGQGVIGQKLVAAGAVDPNQPRPPVPAPNQGSQKAPEKKEERPPSIGRAKIDTVFRGLDAGEKTLREMWELQAKGGKGADVAKFVLETADAIKVPVQILFPPTKGAGMTVETPAQMLTRFIETVLAGPNPTLGNTILRRAVSVNFPMQKETMNGLGDKVDTFLAAKWEASKVVTLRKQEGGGQAS